MLLPLPSASFPYETQQCDCCWPLSGWLTARALRMHQVAAKPWEIRASLRGFDGLRMTHGIFSFWGGRTAREGPGHLHDATPCEKRDFDKRL